MDSPIAGASVPLGNFKVVKPLGSGKFGRVLWVTNRTSGYHLALKFQKARKDEVFNAEYTKRSAANTEMAALCKLAEHPLVCRSHLIFKVSSADFSVFVERERDGFGVSYDDAISMTSASPDPSIENPIRAEDGTIEHPGVLVILFELCDGTVGDEVQTPSGGLALLDDRQLKEQLPLQLLVVLDYIHQHDMAHGDLHEGNILKNGGLLKISDFGLMKDSLSLEIKKFQHADVEEFLKVTARYYLKVHGPESSVASHSPVDDARDEASCGSAGVSASTVTEWVEGMLGDEIEGTGLDYEVKNNISKKFEEEASSSNFLEMLFFTS